MRLYVYALADADLATTGLCGISGEPLEVVTLQDAVGIVGRMTEAKTPTREALQSQDALVRALHERTSALLPVRFGTTVADAAALHDHPTLQHARLTQALDRVRAREQMTVRIVTNRPVPTVSHRESTSTGRGRQYLEGRASEHRLPTEAVEVVSAVRALVREERTERGRVQGMLATVYHLIDRGRGADYRAAMEARASLLTALSIGVAGPSPAYAFGPDDWTPHA